MPPKYFPRADADLLIWLQNLRDQLPGCATAVGMDAATKKSVLDLSTQLTQAIEADEKAYQAYRTAVAHSATMKATTLASLAAALDHVSTAPGCTDAIRVALRLQGSQTHAVSVSSYKVPLAAEAMPGRVVLRWKKGPLDGVNVYGQRGSETEWRFLGRDNRSPYDDVRPLGTPGVPEERRYRVIGVVDDTEVTPESDTVTITLGT
ncbi:MAG TPA: hypothetical protein PKE31_09375 [Pseudomonadota bacterium]|nr:hypothetical protein [Pseudomonadota bacterium]